VALFCPPTRPRFACLSPFAGLWKCQTVLASANEFVPDVKGRASFYAGCTKAIEYLEVFAYEKRGLVVEMESVLAKLI